MKGREKIRKDNLIKIKDKSYIDFQRYFSPDNISKFHGKRRVTLNMLNLTKRAKIRSNEIQE